MEVETGFFQRNNRIMVSAPRNSLSSKEDGDVKDCWDLLNHLTPGFAESFDTGICQCLGAGRDSDYEE